MNTDYLKTFADWLSISYPTSLSPHMELLSLFSTISPMSYVGMGSGKELYKMESGSTCFVTSKESYCNISISGSLLSQVRGSNKMRDLIDILGSAPHNITRLDIAYDTPMPGEQVISNIQRSFHTGFARVAGRDRQMNYNLSQIAKNRHTGTVYFQNGKYSGTILLRVYDKAWEQLQKLSLSVPPTTRYELTVRRGASLRDFTHPDSIFWHFLPDGLLKRPSVVSSWSATERVDYDSFDGSLTTDYERLRFLIQNSPALVQLVEKASSVNGGSMLLEREVRSLLSQYAGGMERSGNLAGSRSLDGLSIDLDA